MRLNVYSGLRQALLRAQLAALRANAAVLAEATAAVQGQVVRRRQLSKFLAFYDVEEADGRAVGRPVSQHSAHPHVLRAARRQ